MSAILQLIEAANAEAERLRHLANTTPRPPFRRVYEEGAERWGNLALAARAELELLQRMVATIRPPDITGS